MAPASKGRYRRLAETYNDDSQDADGGHACDCHQKIKDLRRRLLVCIILCCALAIYIVCLGVRLYPRLIRPMVPLGADPWGLVPFEVGQPASWRSFYNDSRDPYWIDEDTFDNLDDIRRAVRRLKWLQNSTNIRTGGRTTKYRDMNGKEDVLPPYHGSTSTELFGIRSFHQIHCIIVMVEDYGHRLHGESSHWTPGHVMHCINTMRQLTQCMADATPISLIKGSERHLGDGQQMFCRDFDGLRHWANAPERGVRYAITSPPGAKDEYEEIWPYPGESDPPADLW
ncbi:uncharacterized protein LY79DRAFT_527651 [Colletotrichum navitas]|uniref:Uncharacterized protein n=1 Tax=Colletotrichum navitas TaxID=681940 RepID=A0AAD8UZK7_9PEZI|nr:uncharacterized protein LY79DRAFT_527651 [Colletotrichum navitas]KAK1570033.1 hypothetical protein LY79DRAFT_527651 [Colletotrichum navitas]